MSRIATTMICDLPNDLIARVLSSGVLDLKELLTATQTCQCWRLRLAELQTLKLTSAAQCHAGALSLCSSATTVIALVVDEVPDSEWHDGEVRVNLKMAGKLTFALTALPQLERLLLRSDWHTQCGKFGDEYGGTAHNIGVAAVIGLLKAVCDARAAGLLRALKYVAHGGHICPCSEFWTGENASVTEWTEELREEYHECKGRCICRQLLESMPTESVFSYLLSHGLCLGAHSVLEELGERNVDLAGPWVSFPQIIEDSAAGPGYSAMRVDFPSMVPELQRRWGRPLTYCEVFALEFDWAGGYSGYPTRVDEDEEFMTQEEHEMYPEFVLHCLVDLAGASGRELLLRPELADAIIGNDRNNGEAFRELLQEEMELRVNASGEDGSEDGGGVDPSSES